jgi:hypothetical protein
MTSSPSLPLPRFRFLDRLFLFPATARCRGADVALTVFADTALGTEEFEGVDTVGAGTSGANGGNDGG